MCRNQILGDLHQTPVRVPACVHRQVFGIVRVFFVLFKVELSQQLAGFSHGIIHSTVVKTLIGTINLHQNTTFTKQAEC